MRLLIFYIERIHEHWFPMFIFAILLILFSVLTFGARLIEKGVVSGVVQLVGPWTQLQLMCGVLIFCILHLIECMNVIYRASCNDCQQITHWPYSVMNYMRRCVTLVGINCA